MSTSQNPIPVTPYRKDGLADPLFLSMSIGSGESADGSVQFDIATTIGMGGMMLIVEVEQEGKPKIKEHVNLQELVNAWVNQIARTS
jgi:hypothetical protein